MGFTGKIHLRISGWMFSLLPETSQDLSSMARPTAPLPYLSMNPDLYLLYFSHYSSL